LGSTGLAPGTVWLETYGCQMNKAESEAILISLTEEGWQVGRSDRDADLVILNTCSVRETAEERVRGRLGYYRHSKQRRPFTLVLTGCMAERLKEKVLDEFPEVDVVLGTFQKKDLLDALARTTIRKTPVVAAADREYRFAHDHSTTGIKAFVPIMHGCDNWCAYCIVPHVRGPEVSRPAAEVLDEIGRLDARGTAEITLLGQNVNSYRFGTGSDAVDFPALLRMTLERANSIRWVRFLTSHPKDLSPELLAVMAESPRMCRHVHLPLQSGSSRVLAAMRRGYTAEHYLELVERIRSRLPGVGISTDILIGFPGETEVDFMDTLRLVERIGFDDAFTYYYNAREGTPAFAMEDALPEPVKLERLARVIEAQRAATSRAARERLGKEVEVLIEGVSKKDPGELLARTEWDAMVVVPAEQSRIGSFVRVRLASLCGATYRAQLLEQPRTR
jgi:tRNA-2-methylthio-N6-dimethylallyladenosine synthase